MNYSPNFSIANPLADTIREGEDIIAQLRDACDDVQEAIAEERQWYEAYRKLQDQYEAAETEELAEIIVMAQQKEGPLGGIAATSKAYDICLTNLKNSLRRGVLAHLWDKAENARRSYEQAQIVLSQAEARFKAMRVIAEIKTQVLRASTI